MGCCSKNNIALKIHGKLDFSPVLLTNICARKKLIPYVTQIASARHGDYCEDDQEKANDCVCLYRQSGSAKVMILFVLLLELRIA